MGLCVRPYRKAIIYELHVKGFRRRRFLAGAEASELRWFTPAGTEMTDGDWSDASALAIALYLDGSNDPDRAADGTPLLRASSEEIKHW
jgi:pullulanase/glycogen debranching enzyme